jgi:molecular chaperone DnaJ
VRSLLGNVMTSSPCGTCRGYGTVIATPCVTCGGQGRVRARRTVPVDIPAGVDTGLRLQMPGSGEAGPAGGPNGDLYLEVKVKHHDVFSRDGDDLLCTLEVSMTDAILGTTATVKALDGDISLELKPGIQSADIMTVKDRGITHLRGSGRGDLRVGIQVVTPIKLDHKERELIKQFAVSHKHPEPSLAHFQQGLFAKLRDRFLNV